MRKVCLYACVAVVAMSACGGSGDDGSITRSEPAAGPIKQVSVTIEDTSFEMQGEVSSEPTRLVASNEGKQPHQVYLARLNEGVSEADVESALERGPDKLFSMITVAGSFPGEGENFARISPGNTQEITIDFPEGTYMIIDPEVKGPPPLVLFDVKASDGPPVEEPASDYSLETGDFYFTFDEVVAGEATVKITNEGEQGHEVSIGEKVKDEDGEEAAFTFAPPPGGALWTTFDLPPGTYEVVCFFPDTKSGKPHFKLGMETEIRVE